jgi:hypothetical protein
MRDAGRRICYTIGDAPPSHSPGNILARQGYENWCGTTFVRYCLHLTASSTTETTCIPPQGITLKGIMTRDYNKQRREDARPSSRYQPPANGNRDEQAPRPARPRLNRETVDRAWEAGAPMQHADYRPRRSNTSNGQPPRGNWRNNQSSGHSSPQNGRGSFGNQTDHNRRFERTSDNNAGYPSRSFNSDRGRFDDQRGNGYRQNAGPYRGTNRPGFRDNGNPQTNDRRPQGRGSDQGREFQRGNSAGYGPQPREFGRDQRAPRSAERDGRPGYKAPALDEQNPRWQSRPTAQRGGPPGRRAQNNTSTPQRAHFEGDYERFNAPARAPQTEEHHVTRLPDGRVLKGPRPAQRRNAQFWTGVAQETAELLQPLAAEPQAAEGAGVTSQAAQVDEHGAQTEQSPAQVPTAQPAEVEQAELKSVRKTRARTTAPAGRRKKADAPAKPRATGPRPSQRGFKWPEA